MPETVPPNLIHTQTTKWSTGNSADLTYRYKNLDGQHIGARIEELAIGGTSSYHHYHTSEEEHVFILSGQATLFWGDSKIPVSQGDHIWFQAGEEIAHHLINQSDELCTYLVYGERKKDDVVVYPDAQVMMIKSLGRRQFTYRPLITDDSK
jgi:uncharacterized cupin superfamily protein